MACYFLINDFSVSLSQFYSAFRCKYIGDKMQFQSCVLKKKQSTYVFTLIASMCFKLFLPQTHLKIKFYSFIGY